MQLALQVPSSTASTESRPSRIKTVMQVLFALIASFVVAFSAGAVDLETFAGVAGPLTGALTQIALLTPGFKAIVGLVGFIVAFIALAGLRNFGPVIFYLGMAIFGAVGLTVAGAIMGAVV
jgi:hypothetical protein